MKCYRKLGFLSEINKNKFTERIRFKSFENCRPVRKDEVTFYEDKEK